MKLGTSELLIILAVVLIILGPTQIPKLAKMVGKGVKSFKDGLGSDETESAPEPKNVEKKSEEPVAGTVTENGGEKGA